MPSQNASDDAKNKNRRQADMKKDGKEKEAEYSDADPGARRRTDPTAPQAQLNSP